MNQNENENYFRTIQQLISNGADPTIENNECQNSLFLFISSSTDRLVAVLPVGPVGFGSPAIGQDIKKPPTFIKDDLKINKILNLFVGIVEKNERKKFYF